MKTAAHSHDIRQNPDCQTAGRRGRCYSLQLRPRMHRKRREGLRIGVFAPEEGNLLILGDEVRAGLTIFASSAGGLVSDVIQEPDACDADSGADAASAFVEAAVR